MLYRMKLVVSLAIILSLFANSSQAALEKKVSPAKVKTNPRDAVVKVFVTSNSMD